MKKRLGRLSCRKTLEWRLNQEITAFLIQFPSIHISQRIAIFGKIQSARKNDSTQKQLQHNFFKWTRNHQTVHLRHLQKVCPSRQTKCQLLFICWCRSRRKKQKSSTRRGRDEIRLCKVAIRDTACDQIAISLLLFFGHYLTQVNTSQL